jgi:hypothetical protein
VAALFIQDSDHSDQTSSIFPASVSRAAGHCMPVGKPPDLPQQQTPDLDV